MSTIVAAAGGGAWETGGTWVGGVAPTAADDAVLDGTSGSVTVGTNSLCRSLDCTGYTGTLTLGSTARLHVGDGTPGASNIALKLVAGMTLTANAASIIDFISTSATQQTIATAAKSMGAITIKGVGSSYLLSGALTATGTILISSGVFDTGNQTITGVAFSTTGSLTRTITLGSSTINLSGNFSTAATGLTVTSTTSTITLSGASSTFAGGVYGWGTIVFTGGTSITLAATTAINVTYTGTAIKTCSLNITTDITITGTFTVNGNSSLNRVLVRNGAFDGAGATRTITANAVSFSNVDLRDITGSGAANWNLSAITGLSGDCGGNSGITFTTAVPQFAIGVTGTAKVWSDATLWSTSSGGANDGRVPLPQDNVTIDGSSGAGTKFTVDVPRAGATLTWNAGSMQLATSVATEIHGSFTITSAPSTLGANGFTLGGRGSHTISTPAINLTFGLSIECGPGTYTFSNDLSMTGQFVVTTGNLVTSGKNLTCGIFTTNTGGAAAGVSVTLGSSTITLTSTGTVVGVTATGLTLSAASATFVLSNATASARTFAGGGQTYGTLTYTVAGSTGSLTITGNNTFAAINFSDVTNARSLLFANGSITTITSGGSFNVNGTSGKLMTANAVSTTHTLVKNGANVVCSYLSLTGSRATGAANWFAGTTSTDGGSNSNWHFIGECNINRMVA